VNGAPDSQTLLSDQMVYPESPRWHEGKLWFSDVHAYAVKTVDLERRVSVVVEVPGRPAGLGFLPDGRLLVASALDKRLWTWNGTELRLAADLGQVAVGLLNDMVVDGWGRAYVGATGFNLMAGDEPRNGQILLFREAAAAADRVRIVSTDVMFPNGAAISPDGGRYWLSETAAQRVSVFDIAGDGSLTGRRTLIDLPDMCDGLCLDGEGAVWVSLLRLGEFWRVDSHGTVTTKVSAAGRLAVACVLGGADRRSLFLCSAETTMDALAQGRSAGFIHMMAAVPGAGWP
jgi:sugar lactone lactonase YvrE